MPELKLYETGYGSTVVKKGKKGKKNVEIKFSYQMDGDNCTLFPIEDDVDDDNFKGKPVTLNVSKTHSKDIANLPEDGFIMPDVGAGPLKKLNEWQLKREGAEEEEEHLEEPGSAEDKMDEEEDAPEGSEAEEDDAAKSKHKGTKVKDKSDSGHASAWKKRHPKTFASPELDDEYDGESEADDSHSHIHRRLRKQPGAKKNLFEAYRAEVDNLNANEALFCLVKRENAYTLKFINSDKEQKEYLIDFNADKNAFVILTDQAVPPSNIIEAVAFAKLSLAEDEQFDIDKVMKESDCDIGIDDFKTLCSELNQSDDESINEQLGEIDNALNFLAEPNVAKRKQLHNQSSTSDDEAINIRGGKARQKQKKEPAKEFTKVSDDMAKDFKLVLIEELSKLNDDQGNPLIDKTVKNEIFVNRDSKKRDSYLISLPNEIEKHLISSNEVKSRTKVYFDAESGYIKGDIVKWDPTILSQTSDVRSAITHFDYRGISALFIQTFFNLREIQGCEFPWTVTLNFGKMGIPAQPQALRQEVYRRINEIVEKVSIQLEIPDKVGLKLHNDARINVVDVDQPAPAANPQKRVAPDPDNNGNPSKKPRNP